ncbi:unnamed protein product, partial [Rotaria sordida]
MGQPTSRQSQ